MKRTQINNSQLKGFTMIEIIIVVIIIGILSAIVYVSYGSVTSKAKDTSVLSDLDTLDGLVTNYGLKNTLTNWYSSGSKIDDLDFTPSDGNVVDIVVDSSEYCIRGYNPGGTKNSIFNAYTKESSPGVCDGIDPSPQALAIIIQKFG